MGRLLQGGEVLALEGELGTGKTHLIKGLAEGAGVGRSVYVTSPSFTLIHEYQGRIPFYHIDLYRLREEREAEELGLEELFQSGGIVAIEWADRIPSLLPNELLRIQIQYTGRKTRSIELFATGKRYEALLKKFGMRNSEGEMFE